MLSRVLAELKAISTTITAASSASASASASTSASASSSASAPVALQLSAAVVPDGVWEVVTQYLTFYDDSIGVIVHWGLYAVPAFDPVAAAQRRRIQNGSEWYAKRLAVDPDKAYRPPSGWRETQEYHARTYGSDFPYSDFARHFTAEHWDVDSWMAAFKHAGASYAILTAKHHDGFCLWPTATTTFSTAHSRASHFHHSDVLGEFQSACQRWGIRFGVYYSWSEFAQTCTKAYMDSVVIPQINELIRYRPALFWFDGDWSCSTQYAQSVIDRCVARIKHELPHAEINDRIGQKEERKNMAFLGAATYRVFEDRALPDATPAVPWEHVNTIGLSWGRNRQQTESDYKSPAQLLALFERVRALNGRFCLNVGPDAAGMLCPQELDRLQRLGELLP